MRGDCEIVVNRAALEAAVMSGAVRAPSLRNPRWIALRPSAGGLRVETASLDAEIEGEGIWKRWVKVDADLLRGVVGRLGDAPTVALIYVAGRLSIDHTSIPAYGERRRSNAGPRVGRGYSRGWPRSRPASWPSGHGNGPRVPSEASGTRAGCRCSKRKFRLAVGGPAGGYLDATLGGSLQGAPGLPATMH
jgi:hypothetical protein